ncbi:enoyl-CoA hydratase-related protein [Metabacillus idriensis]|uniref:enoyl-CoA hydratase-related protein n=1 Tax=Metabacillus idriensis TaxID=324768 RepID=UPI00204159E0|nr:enoyl-CoA hydratase-related protein [Metabacillus idriensis]MCM3594895.1 enoyl-CoA hydratase-related protein [Metabacillus idriensis]
MYGTIKTEQKEGILTIFLNRPERMNAYTHEMANELMEAYKNADLDDDVRVIIVTGEGKAFCSGMDLGNAGETFSSNESIAEFRDSGGQISLLVHNMKKPIIAAINGPAVGIGLTMTLAMDIRVVKKDAKIGFVFAKRGIGPEACSGWFLPRLVGIGKALEWMYTARYIPTSEALESGLVQYEVDDVLEKAYELAQLIACETASTSNRFVRQLLWNMLSENTPVASHLAESKFLYWAGNNADAKEGIQSFLEKRPPKFPLKISEVPDFFGEEMLR